MHRIVDDEPGRRLSFAWNGPIPQLGNRVASTLAYALFAAGAAAAVFFLNPFDASWRNSFHPWRDVLEASVPVLAMGFVILGTTLATVGWGLIYWSRVSFDAAAGAFSGREEGLLFWFGRDASIPLGDVDAAAFECGAETGAVLPLVCELAGGGRRARVELLLPDVRTRAQAMDIAFRVAKILGFAAYRTARSDQRLLRLELSRSVVGDAAAVPELDPRPATIARSPAPPLEAPPFDPASASDWPTRWVAWEPGKIVQTAFDPSAFEARYFARADLAGTGLGLGFAFLIGGLSMGRPGMSAAGVLALAAGGWLIYDATRARQSRTTLDWTVALASFSEGPENATVALAEVSEVVMTGVNVPGGENTPGGSRCLIALALRGGRRTLAATPRVIGRDAAYKLAYPAAAALARALQRPLVWEEFPARSSFDMSAD